MILSHEQMMEKSWRFIKEVGITDNREEFEENTEGYLVENIYLVRDAYYSDLENNICKDENIIEFLNRHNIKFE